MEELSLVDVNLYSLAQFESISATTYSVEVEEDSVTEVSPLLGSILGREKVYKSDLKKDIPVLFDQFIQYHETAPLTDEVAKTWPKGSGGLDDRTDAVYREIPTLVDVVLVNGDSFFRNPDLSFAWAPRETAKVSTDGFQWCPWGGPFNKIDTISTQQFADNCARCILRMLEDRPRISLAVVCFTKHKRVASVSLSHLDCTPEQNYGSGKRKEPLPKLNKQLSLAQLRELGRSDDSYVSLVCNRIAIAIAQTRIVSPRVIPASGARIILDCDWGLQSSLSLVFGDTQFEFTGWIDQRNAFSKLYTPIVTEPATPGETPAQRHERAQREKQKEKTRNHLLKNLTLRESSRSVPEASDCCLAYLYWLLHSDPFRKATTTKKEGEKEAEQYTIELLSDSDDWFLRIMLILYGWRAGRRMTPNMIAIARQYIPEFKAAYDAAGQDDRRQERVIRKYEIQILTNPQVAEQGVDWLLWELSGAGQVYMHKISHRQTGGEKKKKKQKKKKTTEVEEIEEESADAGEVGEHTASQLWDLSKLTSTFTRGVGKGYFAKGVDARDKLAEASRDENRPARQALLSQHATMQLKSNAMLATKGIFDSASIAAVVVCVQLANALNADLLYRERTSYIRDADIARLYFSHSRVISRWLQIVEDSRFDFVQHQLCMVDLSAGIVRMHQWNFMLFALALLKHGGSGPGHGTNDLVDFFFSNHSKQGTLKLVMSPFGERRSQTEEELLNFDYLRSSRRTSTGSESEPPMGGQENVLSFGSPISSPQQPPASPISATEKPSNPGFDFLDAEMIALSEAERNKFLEHITRLFGAASKKWFMAELDALMRDPREGLDVDNPSSMSLLPPVSVEEDGSVHSMGILSDEVLYQFAAAMQGMKNTDFTKFIRTIDEDRENKNNRLLVKADADVREYIDRIRAADPDKKGPQNTTRREAIPESTAAQIKLVFYDAPLAVLEQYVDRVLSRPLRNAQFPDIQTGSTRNIAVDSYCSAEELRAEVARAFVENGDRMVDRMRAEAARLLPHLAIPDPTAVTVGVNDGGSFLYAATQMRKILYDCFDIYLQGFLYTRAPLLQVGYAAPTFLRSLLSRTWWNCICDFRCSEWTFRHGGQLMPQGMLPRPYDVVRARVSLPSVDTNQRNITWHADKQQDALGDAGQWGSVRLEQRNAPNRGHLRSLSVVHEDERTSLGSTRLRPFGANSFVWKSGIRTQYRSLVSSQLSGTSAARDSTLSVVGKRLDNDDARQLFDQSGVVLHARYDDTSGWEPVDTHTRIAYEVTDRRSIVKSEHEPELLEWQEPPTLCRLEGAKVDDQTAVPNIDKGVSVYSTAYYHAITEGDADPYGNRSNEPLPEDSWTKALRETAQTIYTKPHDVQVAIFTALRNYSDSLLPHKTNSILVIDENVQQEAGGFDRRLNAYSYLFGNRSETTRPLAPKLVQQGGNLEESVLVYHSTENVKLNSVSQLSDLLFYSVFKILPDGFLSGDEQTMRDIKYISLASREVIQILIQIVTVLYPSSTASDPFTVLMEPLQLLLSSETLYDICEFFETCLVANFNSPLEPRASAIVTLVMAIMSPDNRNRSRLPVEVQHAIQDMFKCDMRLRHITRVIQMVSEVHARVQREGDLLVPISLDPLLPSTDLNMQVQTREFENDTLVTLRICEYNSLLDPSNGERTGSRELGIERFEEQYLNISGAVAPRIVTQLDSNSVSVNSDLLAERGTKEPILLCLRDNWDGKDYLTAVWSRSVLSTAGSRGTPIRVETEAELLPWLFSAQGSSLLCRLRWGPVDWLIRFVDQIANAANRDIDYAFVDGYFKMLFGRYKVVKVSNFNATHISQTITTGSLIHSLYASKLDTYYELSPTPAIALRLKQRDVSSENVALKIQHAFSRDVYEKKQRELDESFIEDSTPALARVMASQRSFSIHPVLRSVRDSVLLLEFNCRISTATSREVYGPCSRLPMWIPTEKRWLCLFNWCAYKNLRQDQVTELLAQAKRMTMDDAQATQPEPRPVNVCLPVPDMEYLIVPWATADEIFAKGALPKRRLYVDFPVGITLPRYDPYTTKEITAEQAANLALYVNDTVIVPWLSESYLGGLCHGVGNDMLAIAVVINELKRQRAINDPGAQQPPRSRQRRSLADDNVYGRARLLKYLHSTLGLEKVIGNRATFLIPKQESIRKALLNFAMTGNFAEAVGREIYPRSPYMWTGNGRDLREKLIPELIERLRDMCRIHITLQDAITKQEPRSFDLMILDEMLLAYSSPERLGLNAAHTSTETQLEEETVAIVEAAEQDTWYERLRSVATPDKPIVMRTTRHELVLFRTLLVRYSNVARLPSGKQLLAKLTDDMDIRRRSDMAATHGILIASVGLGEIIEVLAQLAQQQSSGLTIEEPSGTEEMREALSQNTDTTIQLADGRLNGDIQVFVLPRDSVNFRYRTNALTTVSFLTVEESILERKEKLRELNLLVKGKQLEEPEQRQLLLLCPRTTQTTAEFTVAEFVLNEALHWNHTRENIDIRFLQLLGANLKAAYSRSADAVTQLIRDSVDIITVAPNSTRSPEEYRYRLKIAAGTHLQDIVPLYMGRDISDTILAQDAEQAPNPEDREPLSTRESLLSLLSCLLDMNGLMAKTSLFVHQNNLQQDQNRKYIAENIQATLPPRMNTEEVRQAAGELYTIVEGEQRAAANVMLGRLMETILADTMNVNEEKIEEEKNEIITQILRFFSRSMGVSVALHQITFDTITEAYVANLQAVEICIGSEDNRSMESLSMLDRVNVACMPHTQHYELFLQHTNINLL